MPHEPRPIRTDEDRHPRTLDPEKVRRMMALVRRRPRPARRPPPPRTRTR